MFCICILRWLSYFLFQSQSINHSIESIYYLSPLHNPVAVDLCKFVELFQGVLIYPLQTFAATRIELLCIGFHYVESVYFCWTKHFNFLLNNHNNLFSFELFGKLFHIIAPLYLTATWCLFCPCDNVFVGGTGMQAIWLLKTGQNL